MFWGVGADDIEDLRTRLGCMGKDADSLASLAELLGADLCVEADECVVGIREGFRAVLAVVVEEGDAQGVDALGDGGDGGPYGGHVWLMVGFAR